MHHLIQISGTPDEVKVQLGAGVSLPDAYEQKLHAAVVNAVLAVLEGCSGKVSVSVLCNTHSAEVHPPANISEEQMEKHKLGALQDGKAQSLNLTVTAQLI